MNGKWPGEVEGFGASYDREGDRWLIYTMPGTKPLGSVEGHDKARIDWVMQALRSALDRDGERRDALAEGSRETISD